MQNAHNSSVENKIKEDMFLKGFWLYVMLESQSIS